MKYDISITDESGVPIGLELGDNPANGQPMYKTTVLDQLQPPVVIGEASYASMNPRVGGAYVQPDLSDGVGQRVQVALTDPNGKRYRYANGMDASVAGQIGPGPKITTIAKIANGGPLTGAFELAGKLYLVGSRIVSLVDADALTHSSVEDLGAGVVGYSPATWLQTGTETSDQASAGTGASFVLSGPQMQACQLVTPGVTGELGRVDLQLVRTDTVSVQTVTVGGVPTGGTLLLTYAGGQTSALAYNITAADMQTALRLLAGLSAVTVIKAGWIYTITFTGVTGAAQYLVADGSALTGGTAANATVAIARIGTTVTGDVQVAVQTRLNGRPTGVDVAVAAVNSAGVPASAGTVPFRFDDGGRFLQVKGEPFYLVLRAIGATPTATIAITRTTAGTQDGYSTIDSGNSWTATYRFKYEGFVKALTTAAFLGKAQGAKFLTTTDGATYTADPAYEGKHFCTFADLLIRDCRETSAGAISWSSDGKNWSEPLAVGSPNVEIAGLLALPNVVLVCKTDSIWAVDPTETPPLVDSIMWASANAANGVGAYVWGQTAYIPFNAGLTYVGGDFTNGFDVPKAHDIGPTALPGWESPWGAGRVVAAAGDRFSLYVAVSTSTSYKLFKSADPKSGHWHGAIADLGTPTALNMMYVFDRGGAYSPVLLFSTDADDIGAILCPRNANPWSDSSYQVSTTTGQLFLPTATGQFAVDPKAWLRESLTFRKTAAGGYGEMLWDTLDGVGWRMVEGRWYDTGTYALRAGLLSLLLDQQVQLTAASATAYPLLVAAGLALAVRSDRELKQFTFTVVAEGGMSGTRLGQMLGATGQTISDVMAGGVFSSGTRTLTDPWGEQHEVLVLNVAESIMRRSEIGKAAVLEITAVSGG